MKHILSSLFIFVVLIFFPAGYAFSLGKIQAASKKDFNIVLITIDTLRADHLSCYGYNRETSPHIDKIAEKGILFKNVIAPSSWTAPSMVSLFTSTYPVNHGVTYGLNWRRKKEYSQDVFSKKLTTIPEVLKKMGYTTFGVSSNHNLTKDLGFARGFDYFRYLDFPSASEIQEFVYSWEDIIKKSGKYFLWIHYMDPHHPYHARSPWIADYAPQSLTRTLNFSDKSSGELNRLIPTFKSNPQQLSNLIALYDSEINYVDSHIGELIQKFDLERNTVLIITSDHGEEFLEHGLIGHAWNLYQETIHIPLIIKLPYSSEKQLVDKSINLIDIMPTILDILDIEPPEQTVGTSALEKEGLLFFLERMFMGNGESEYSFAELDKLLNLKAVITPQWKYIYDYDKKTEQLYNIKSDPGEFTNLADKEPDRCTKFKKDLLSWVSGAKKYPAVKQQVQLSKEEEGKLEALGYLTRGNLEPGHSQEEPAISVEKNIEKKGKDIKALSDKDAVLTIVERSSTGFAVNLTNKIPVVGVQFTVSRVNIVDVQTTARTSGFATTFNDETGKVIMIAPSGKTIDSGLGVIAHIACQGVQEASLSEIKISR